LINFILKKEDLTESEATLLKTLGTKANFSHGDRDQLKSLVSEYRNSSENAQKARQPSNQWVKKISELLEKSGLATLEQDRLITLIQDKDFTTEKSAELMAILNKSNLSAQDQKELKNCLLKTYYKLNTFDPVNCKDELEHRQL
jgi:hypothetical protein